MLIIDNQKTYDKTYGVKNDHLNKEINFNIDDEEEWCFYLIYL